MLLLVSIGLSLYYDHRLENDPVHYQVAEITKFSRGAKVAPWFDYSFSLNGQEFEGSYSIADKMSKENNSYLQSYIGGKFVVRYNISDPKLNRLMINCPVPDSIVSVPAEGWEHPPFGCGGR